MEAKLRQQGEVTIVTLSGKIDIEKNHQFKSVCLEKLANRKLVFQMSQLNFVGSTGIQAFFQAVMEINRQNPYGLKLTGLKEDFRRVLHFQNMNEQIQLHESLEEAVKSFV